MTHSLVHQTWEHWDIKEEQVPQKQAKAQGQVMHQISGGT
jgi:hypothetical protein